MTNTAYINKEGQLAIRFNGETKIVRKTKKATAAYATVTITEFDGTFEFAPNRPNTRGIGKIHDQAKPKVIYKRLVNKQTGEKVYRDCRTDEDLEVAKRQGEVKDGYTVFKKQAPKWFRPGGLVYYQQPKYKIHVLPIQQKEQI